MTRYITTKTPEHVGPKPPPPALNLQSHPEDLLARLMRDDAARIKAASRPTREAPPPLDNAMARFAPHLPGSTEEIRRALGITGETARRVLLRLQTAGRVDRRIEMRGLYRVTVWEETPALNGKGGE